MKRKVLEISLFLFYILGSVVFLTACGQRRFIGNHVVEDSFYRLDIDCMTGTDQITMELSAGDTLAVQFETVKETFIFNKWMERKLRGLTIQYLKLWAS